MAIEELERLLRARVESAVAGGAAPLGKVAKFDLGGDGLLLLDGTASPPRVGRADGPADCTLTLSAADFARILAGDLDPTGAFMTGRLTMQGDMGLAMQLATLLG